MLKHQIAKHNQEAYEKSEAYEKEQEAKQEFFWLQGEKVLSEFSGATIGDIIEFADKLKKWANETEFQPSGIEKTVMREYFYQSKL